MLGKLTECKNENKKLKENKMFDNDRNNDRRTGTDYEYDMHLSKVVQAMMKEAKEKYSKVKFLFTTNERYKYFEGKIGVLEVEIVALFFGEGREDRLKTSLIKNCKMEDNILEIETKNSMYKFEILK